jgi:hypothetical protein
MGFVNASLFTVSRVDGISHAATEKPPYISRQNSPLATPDQDGVGWTIIGMTPPSAKAAAVVRGKLKLVVTPTELIRPITCW